MLSSERLKLSIITCYEKNHFLKKKLKTLLYFLKKHSKILSSREFKVLLINTKIL